MLELDQAEGQPRPTAVGADEVVAIQGKAEDAPEPEP